MKIRFLENCSRKVLCIIGAIAILLASFPIGLLAGAVGSEVDLQSSNFADVLEGNSNFTVGGVDSEKEYLYVQNKETTPVVLTFSGVDLIAGEEYTLEFDAYMLREAIHNGNTFMSVCLQDENGTVFDEAIENTDLILEKWANWNHTFTAAKTANTVTLTLYGMSKAIFGDISLIDSDGEATVLDIAPVVEAADPNYVMSLTLTEIFALRPDVIDGYLDIKIPTSGKSSDNTIIDIPIPELQPGDYKVSTEVFFTQFGTDKICMAVALDSTSYNQNIFIDAANVPLRTETVVSSSMNVAEATSKIRYHIYNGSNLRIDNITVTDLSGGTVYYTQDFEAPVTVNPQGGTVVQKGYYVEEEAQALAVDDLPASVLTMSADTNTALLLDSTATAVENKPFHLGQYGVPSFAGKLTAGENYTLKMDVYPVTLVSGTALHFRLTQNADSGTVGTGTFWNGTDLTADKWSTISTTFSIADGKTVADAGYYRLYFYNGVKMYIDNLRLEDAEGNVVEGTEVSFDGLTVPSDFATATSLVTDAPEIPSEAERAVAYKWTYGNKDTLFPNGNGAVLYGSKAGTELRMSFDYMYDGTENGLYLSTNGSTSQQEIVNITSTSGHFDGTVVTANDGAARICVVSREQGKTLYLWNVRIWMDGAEISGFTLTDNTAMEDNTVETIALADIPGYGDEEEAIPVTHWYGNSNSYGSLLDLSDVSYGNPAGQQIAISFDYYIGAGYFTVKNYATGHDIGTLDGSGTFSYEGTIPNNAGTVAVALQCSSGDFDIYIWNATITYKDGERAWTPTSDLGAVETVTLNDVPGYGDEETIPVTHWYGNSASYSSLLDLSDVSYGNPAGQQIAISFDYYIGAGYFMVKNYATGHDIGTLDGSGTFSYEGTIPNNAGTVAVALQCGSGDFDIYIWNATITYKDGERAWTPTSDVGTVETVTLADVPGDDEASTTDIAYLKGKTTADKKAALNLGGSLEDLKLESNKTYKLTLNYYQAKAANVGITDLFTLTADKDALGMDEDVEASFKKNDSTGWTYGALIFTTGDISDNTEDWLTITLSEGAWVYFDSLKVVEYEADNNRTYTLIDFEQANNSVYPSSSDANGTFEQTNTLPSNVTSNGSNGYLYFSNTKVSDGDTVNQKQFNGIKLESYTTYRISIDYYAEEDFNKVYTVAMGYSPSNIGSGTSSQAYEDEGFITSGKKGWNTHSIEFTTGEVVPNKHYIYLSVYNDKSDNFREVYFDNLKITKLYSVAAESNDANIGTVSSAFQAVAAGETVSVTAKYFDGVTFEGWYQYGDLVSTEETFVVENIADNYKLEARFSGTPRKPSTFIQSFEDYEAGIIKEGSYKIVEDASLAKHGDKVFMIYGDPLTENVDNSVFFPLISNINMYMKNDIIYDIYIWVKPIDEVDSHFYAAIVNGNFGKDMNDHSSSGVSMTGVQQTIKPHDFNAIEVTDDGWMKFSLGVIEKKIADKETFELQLSKTAPNFSSGATLDNFYIDYIEVVERALDYENELFTEIIYNEIPNGTFEEPITDENWGPLTDGVTVEKIDAEYEWQGDYAFKFDAAKSNGTEYVLPMMIRPGKLHTFAAWLNLSKGSDIQVGVFADGEYTQLDHIYGSTDGNLALIDDGKWHRISYVFIPPTESTHVYLVIRGTTGTLWMDNADLFASIHGVTEDTNTYGEIVEEEDKYEIEDPIKTETKTDITYEEVIIPGTPDKIVEVEVEVPVEEPDTEEPDEEEGNQPTGRYKTVVVTKNIPVTIPMWAVIVAGVAALVLIAGVVLTIIILKKKNKKEEKNNA